MEEALARGTDVSASARARLLFGAGTLAQVVADWRPARTMAEESLRLFRQLGDEEGVAYVSGTVGIVALGQERYEEGLALLEEAVDLNLKIGEKWAASLLLGLTAPVPLVQGDPARARRLSQKALSLAREIGSRDGVYVALLMLATVEWTEGDHERAARSFEEGLSLSAEVGEESHVAYFLEGLAAVAASENRLVRAARLWGAAEALLEKIEVIAYTYEDVRSLYQHRMDAARSRLDGARWEAAREEGWAMTPEQAMEYALGEVEEEPLPVPEENDSSAPMTPPAGLSAREAEVLELVAKGLTNAKIAEELFISPNTVNRHLNSVYGKLGISSRAAATRFALEHGLA
jgi:ATP/maltotriose-dependent transcriptional regulator MalT